MPVRAESSWTTRDLGRFKQRTGAGTRGDVPGGGCTAAAANSCISSRADVPMLSGFPLPPRRWIHSHPHHPPLVGVMAPNVELEQVFPTWEKAAQRQGESSGCFVTPFQIKASVSDHKVEMPEAAIWGEAHAICPFELAPKPKSVALGAEVLPSPQTQSEPFFFTTARPGGDSCVHHAKSHL